MRPREFKVEKIGDTYVTVPVDRYPNATRATFGVWAYLLGVLGLSNRGFRGVFLCTASGLMAYRAITGRSPLPALFSCQGLCPEPRAARPGLAPSYQNDHSHKAGQMPADGVDEASMESFPASDPPAKMSAALAK